MADIQVTAVGDLYWEGDIYWSIDTRHSTTAADGSFEMTIFPGTYMIQFNDWTDAYVNETYDGAIYGYDDLFSDDVGDLRELHTPVEVVNGETVTVSATLAQASQLSGRITSVGEEQIVEGEVEIYLNDGSGQYGDPVNSGRVESDGSYTIVPVSAGTYHVCYNVTVALESRNTPIYGCYDGGAGGTTPAYGTDVVIGVDERATLDIIVDAEQERGVVAGAVVDATGEPTAGITVRAVRVVDGQDSLIRTSTTNERGEYSFIYLQDGTYRIRFEDRSHLHLTSYYGGHQLEDATLISIENGSNIENVDGSLLLGGQITGVVARGTVTNTEWLGENAYFGSSGWGGSLILNSVDGEITQRSEIDMSGHYTLTGLPSGEYIVQTTSEYFDPEFGSESYAWYENYYYFQGFPLVSTSSTELQRYRDEYYGDAQFPENATVIAVTVGEVSTADFVLDEAVEPTLAITITTRDPLPMRLDPWSGELTLSVTPGLTDTIATSELSCPAGTVATDATLFIGDKSFVMSPDGGNVWRAALFDINNWLVRGVGSIDWRCIDPLTTFPQEIELSSTMDAAEERADGTMYLDSSDLEIGRDAGANQLVGLRYQSINIPPNVTITDAKLIFTVDEPQAEPASGTFFGESVGNTEPFSDTLNNLSNRDRTTTSVAWSDIPTWDESDVGSRVESPSLVSIIQEIVDGSGWSAGNSLAIIIEGEGRRSVASYNGDSTNAPVLQIEYSTAEQAPNQANVPLSVHLQQTNITQQYTPSLLITVVSMFIVLVLLTNRSQVIRQ